MSRNQYQSNGVKQIVMRNAETGRVARATFVRGFKGWTVVGEDNGQGVGCMNGTSETFRRSEALRMVELFVNTGRDFL
jgi:hypothetical protein